MRLTNSMLVQNVTNNLYNNLARMNKLNTQLSSGKRINLPSDDPAAVARSLSLRAAVADTEQFTSNLADAKAWLQATDSALMGAEDVLRRVKELAVKGSNSATLSAEEQQAIADEVDQLIDQMVSIANTNHEGRFVFAGYQTLQEPFSRTGDTIASHGDDGAIEYRIGPQQILAANLDGREVFGADETTPDRIFKVLIEIKQHLENGDGGQVSGSLEELSSSLDNLLQYHSEIGAKMNRVELAGSHMSQLKVNYQQLQSENEDADMAEVIMDLKTSELVYRASLGAGARVIMPTLMDFLS
jgi:flagellar hook-associated protein 3 FlgL